MSSSVVEDYLQTIHYLTRDGVPVIAARLAERMGVSAPTVTATLQRMQRDDLIRHRDRREIVFTDRGRTLADNIVRRHALAERLLTDLLRMPWYEAHEEAHGVEHAITPKLEARLLQVLGHPTTCPHGNPIPGLGQLAPDEFPLHEARVGDNVVIQRITEEAEDDAGSMEYLQQHGVSPGACLRVKESSGFNALLVLQGEAGREIALSYSVAAKLRAIRQPSRARSELAIAP